MYGLHVNYIYKRGSGFLVNTPHLQYEDQLVTPLFSVRFILMSRVYWQNVEFFDV
jgi:hypothetical protein